MSEKPVSRPYSVRNQIRWLLNNELFSDVAFLIGGKKVFAHKNIVSLGSEAFAGMLYGSMKEEGSEIEILDVEYEGFLNVMRYLYGFEISEIADNLAHLSSTYMVADRYLVEHLKEGLIEHIDSILDPSNCLMIYDQLLKLPEGVEETIKQQVERHVQSKAKSAFDNEYLPNISQKTLINLLSLKWLALPEIEVLKGCASWIKAETLRNGWAPDSEDKKEICESFKNLILFEKLTIKDLDGLQDLRWFLTADEVSYLFLHLANKANYPLQIKPETPRRTLQKFSVLAKCDQPAEHSKNYNKKTLVNVNRKIFLSQIHTTISKYVRRVHFSIKSGDKELKLGDNRADCVLIANRECFNYSIAFRELYELDPQKSYSFNFIVRTPSGYSTSYDLGGLSNQKKLELTSGEESFSFTLDFRQTHFIGGITFYALV